ncbi:MAG TPA: hypothetical protein VMB49_03720 [Acidobacteriaceae bacterium]|nr:hypothetical protein [Acidobacteriaceae bacterium]
MIAAATILHVGDDICHRIPVMKKSGFAVLRSDCSAGGIRDAFARKIPFSVVTFHNALSAPSPSLVSTARSLTAAPFALFANPFVDFDQELFELVIFAYTRPEIWVEALRSTIEEAHRIRSLSRQLRADSAALRATARALCDAALSNRMPDLYGWSTPANDGKVASAESSSDRNPADKEKRRF